MHWLRNQVTEIERLSARIVDLRRQAATPTAGVAAPGPPPPPEVLAQISDNLDLLEQAQAELAEIERASGLGDPSEVLRRR